MASLRIIRSPALLCVGLLLLLLSGGCEGGAPTVPAPAAGTPPPSPGPLTLSGMLWVHGSEGVRPLSNGAYFGWIETATSGHTTGRLTADANGRYSLGVSRGTRVRIQGVGSYQPCAVTITITDSVVRDVHLVEDVSQLGARLPAVLASQTPLISGLVFETTSAGRVPVKDVRVETDGLFGLGLVTATTLTDEEGRFILCGQDGDRETYLFAGKAGYRLAEVGMIPIDGVPLSIELVRSASAAQDH